MNTDELMVVISLRWESPSSTFIRLCKCFILIMPRVDIVPSVGLTWLHLEGCDQVLASWRLSRQSAPAWKTGGTWTNSSPPLSLPLGLYAWNGNWLWRSKTGTGSLNAVKHKFVIAVGLAPCWAAHCKNNKSFVVREFILEDFVDGLSVWRVCGDLPQHWQQIWTNPDSKCETKCQNWNG